MKCSRMCQEVLWGVLWEGQKEEVPKLLESDAQIPEDLGV